MPNLIGKSTAPSISIPPPASYTVSRLGQRGASAASAERIRTLSEAALRPPSMWVTKHSLDEVAGAVLVDDRVSPLQPRCPRARCKECDSPLSYLLTGRVLLGHGVVRLVGEAYCQYCSGHPTAPSYGAPIDSAEIVRITL